MVNRPTQMRSSAPSTLQDNFKLFAGIEGRHAASLAAFDFSAGDAC
jgi:hypothetical protein